MIIFWKTIKLIETEPAEPKFVQSVFGKMHLLKILKESKGTDNYNKHKKTDVKVKDKKDRICYPSYLSFTLRLFSKRLLQFEGIVSKIRRDSCGKSKPGETPQVVNDLGGSRIARGKRDYFLL